MGGVCVCSSNSGRKLQSVATFFYCWPNVCNHQPSFFVVQLGVTLVWQPYVHATFTAEPRGMLAERAANVYLYSDMCSTKDADSWYVKSRATAAISPVCFRFCHLHTPITARYFEHFLTMSQFDILVFFLHCFFATPFSFCGWFLNQFSSLTLGPQVIRI
jgi:hypothetical protein